MFRPTDSQAPRLSETLSFLTVKTMTVVCYLIVAMSEEKTTGELVGYIRVSTDTQKLDLQVDAMTAAGVGRVFQDFGISGTVAERPGLTEALSYVRSGDTLVVYSLSRIARNTRNLLELVESLNARGIRLRSLTEGIDTSGAMSVALLTIMGAINTLERDLIVERSKAGVAAARARGVKVGRKPKLTGKQHSMVRSLYDARNLSISEIAEQMKVSEATIYRSLRTSV